MTITKSIGLIFLVLLMITLVSAGGYEPILPDATDGTGSVLITVLCHNNIFSKEMILTNDIAPDENKSIYLDPDGTFYDRYIPGNYTVILLDGNGGQPETREFRVDPGYSSYVTFIGHAFSGIDAPEPTITPSPTVTPTVTPTPTPTETPVPTPTPTPTPLPCYTIWVWHPGYWGVLSDISDWRTGCIKWIWHDGYWELKTICP